MLQLERCTVVMQEPFPVLRTLFLHCDENDSEAPVVLGALFKLGGSAPLLQKITLWRVPFPTLPKLLLSTTDLVELSILTRSQALGTFHSTHWPNACPR